MKKLICFSLLLLGIAPAVAQTGSTEYAAAQPQDVRPIKLGFLAKPAATWLSADNPELDSKGVRLGFSFGLLMDFSIARSPNYALSTGLMINLADGGKLNYADYQTPSNPQGTEFRDYYGTTDISLNFQWLEVPVTLKLKTNQIGYMTYFGQLGLQGGVNLSAKQSGDFRFKTTEAPRLIENENINKSTRLFNAGLLVGIGAEYNISGNTNILFGVSYYRGFTNVLKGNVYQLESDDNVFLQNSEDPDVGPEPLYGAKRSAVLNNISLNIGVIF